MDTIDYGSNSDREQNSFSPESENASQMSASLDALGLSQMMIEFAPDGTIIKANDNYLDIMGYRFPEVEGKHHRMFCEPDFQRSVEYTKFWENLRNGMNQSGEFKRINKTGEEVWLQAAYNPVMENGKVVRILKNAVDVTERVNAQRTILAQSRSLLELSTPVINIWRGIVMMPLIGVIDTARAKQITETLLQCISESSSTVAILDITGVPVMDTSVAQNLLKTVTAAKMLGSKIIVTGISPETAQTLVKLGIDLSHITTRGTLSAGLSEAFRLLGMQVTTVSRVVE